MKALHIIPSLANWSGPTHVVVNLAENLTRLGCQVSVYHLEYDGVEPLLPQAGLIETKAFSLTLPGPPARWGYSAGLARALRQTVARFDIVHIHSVWMYPTIAAVRACLKRAIPYVLRPAGSFRPQALFGNRMLKGLYYWLFEKAHLDNAAALHAVSMLEANEFQQLGFCAPVCIIPNGVASSLLGDFQSKETARSRFGLKAEEKVVLFLGRLHPIKGLDLLTASFAQVLQHLPEARLILAGPPAPTAPTYAREVKRMVESQGIKEHTILTGELRGEAKWLAYRAADVFVLPSRSENFGIAVAEAMACGVPVVVSNQTPWQDVETHNAGCWVELKREEIAKHIIEILEQVELARKMGENGRDLVRKKYTWDRIAKRMLRVYENIVAGLDPNAALLEEGPKTLSYAKSGGVRIC